MTPILQSWHGGANPLPGRLVLIWGERGDGPYGPVLSDGLDWGPGHPSPIATYQYAGPYLDEPTPAERTSMTTPTIANRTRRIIQEHLGADEAPDTANLFDDLGADSLDTVELVMALEEEFGIEILEDDMTTLSTVGAAIATMERLAG